MGEWCVNSWYGFVFLGRSVLDLVGAFCGASWVMFWVFAGEISWEAS